MIPGAYAQFDFIDARIQENKAKRAAEAQKLAEASVSKHSTVNEDDIFAADESDSEKKDSKRSPNKNMQSVDSKIMNS